MGGQKVGKPPIHGGENMAQVSSTEYEQLINDYEDLWNGDLSKMDIVSESVAIYNPAHPDREVHGHDEFEEFIQRTHEAYPDFEVSKDPETMLMSDDTLMGEWTLTGTFEEPFYGIPPTGRRVKLRGMSKMTLVDGKIQEDYIYFNEKEMLEQLGYTFPDIVPLIPKLALEKIRNALVNPKSRGQ